MANLKVKIILRLTASKGRGWVEASGKTDPPGTYYLRFFHLPLCPQVADSTSS